VAFCSVTAEHTGGLLPLTRHFLKPPFAPVVARLLSANSTILKFDITCLNTFGIHSFPS